MKWVIRISIFAVLVLVVIFVWQMIDCKKKGSKSGSAFKCKMFKSEPVYLAPHREYYKIKDDGKCYRIMDYGSRMGFKEVDRHNCR